jgi:hypothetical protein
VLERENDVQRKYLIDHLFFENFFQFFHLLLALERLMSVNEKKDEQISKHLNPWI